MKGIKKGLAILLVLCTLLSLVFVAGAAPMPQSADADQVQATAASSEDGYKYSIVMVDCGRKYFSVSSLKSIIDSAASAGMNYVMLGIGNDGLRFLLDDMSLTVGGNKYESKAVSDAIHAGNEAYSDFAVDELSETDMNNIVAYAREKGVGIIPLINTPGHMDAILDCIESCTGDNTVSFDNSARTIDVTNSEATAFTKALLQKYINYFAGKGCKLFNMGCDEYANDIYPSGSMGFGQLQREGNYGKFVTYVNEVAAMVEEAGMIPMAFNDGIYFNNVTTSGTFNTGILVCYWSPGWNSYSVASASFLKEKGFNLINTNGSYYWIVGGNKCTADKASQFDVHTFPALNNTTVNIDNPVGAMFCIWSDTPQAEEDTSVATNVAPVISAFGEKLPATTAGGDTGNTDDKEEPITVSVTVAVNATSQEYTQDGRVDTEGTYTTSDGIASYTVTHNTNTTKDRVETTPVGSNLQNGTYLIGNGTQWLKLNGSTLGTTTDPAEATQWKITKSGDSYTIQSGGYYLGWNTKTASSFGTDYTYTLAAKTDAQNWSYNNGFYSNLITRDPWIGSNTYNNYYLRCDNGWQISTTNSNNGAAYTFETIPGTTTESTAITFTGKAVGTTYVTVGDTRYTITVTEEDLSAVAPLTVEYWVTNSPVTADGATSKTISASDVYSESGVLFSDLVPAAGKKGNDNMVFWKGTRLASDNKQTGDSGVDKTRSGSDFTYIRYWDGSWAYSADGKSWTDVANGDQIVAYYLQKTEVTDEVTTYVVDWGPTKGEWSGLNYLGTKYVLVDYAVRYESGEVVPSAFPTEKSIAFHCDTGTTQGVYYYRTLGMILAEETSDFEVYMITLTPTSDNPSTTLASTAANNSSYSYNGTEVVAWAATQDDLDNSGLGTYRSISDEFTYSIGGEPIVSGLEIYRQHGMKVTYYVRAKVTEDSLTVHYIDQTANNQEFYNYNIAVAKGTLFNENIALATPNWKGNLRNGSVTNLLGNTQTVSADLSIMPAIGAQYRYSDYTCVKVERSDDGKEVFLYYTFNNVHSFVVDFGLPVNITAANLGIDGNVTFTRVSGANYGTATVSGSTITYTPAQTMKNVESLQLTFSDSKGETATCQIYIYPATTVYYEESFGTFPTGSITGTAPAGNQAAEVAGHKEYNYGYDAAYAGSVGNSNGTVAKLETGEQGTFTFTGTGVDVYACTMENSGKVMIYVYQGENLKRLITVDTRQRGDQSAKDTAYNVPIVSLSDLAYGEYTLVMKEVQTKTDTGKENLPVYIDGFRVHGTLDVVNTQVYKDDNEANPTFVELRNAVLAYAQVNTNDSQYANQIAQNTMSQVYATDEVGEGAVVIVPSEQGVVTNPEDILDKGPKNELYLRNGQAVVFKLADPSANVQVGLKALNKATNYRINNGNSVALNTSTDMFYEVTPDDSGVVAITNNGEGILSITEVKVIGASASTASTFAALSANDLMPALLSMGFEAEPVAATATLNITVQCGDKAVPVTLTADGMSGDTHTFTAAEIKAAVEKALPEGYNVDDVTFSDVTVTCGESADVSFTAAQTQTPDVPDSFIGKIIAVAKRVINRIIGWFR